MRKILGRRNIDCFANWWYNRGMKIKTSVTLSKELLTAIDRVAGEGQNRSSLLENAAWAYLENLQRAGQNARDLELMNQHADELNAEMEDILSYQVAV